MASSGLAGVSRYHLLRFNGQQDLLFIRLDMDKQQNMLEAALQAAPGGVWVGEYAASDDEETVQAIVFVNAMTSSGLKREEVIDAAQPCGVGLVPETGSAGHGDLRGLSRALSPRL